MFGAQNSFGHGARSHCEGNVGPSYDPESLITGSEIAAGMTYYDKRDWPDIQTWKLACQGKLTTAAILRVAPRIKAPKEGDK